MSKLSKQIERIDELCAEIAQLELDNWDVIQRFRSMEMQIERRYRELKKYCDAGVIKKKVEDIKGKQGSPRRPRRGGLVVKRRLNGFDKWQLTRAMVDDFRKQRLKKVSLDEINEWLSQPVGKQDDIRDRLLIRGIKIPQVNWFHIRETVKGKEKIVKLYDQHAYETAKAPHKSYFNVEAWHKYLMSKGHKDLAKRW